MVVDRGAQCDLPLVDSRELRAWYLAYATVRSAPLHNGPLTIYRTFVPGWNPLMGPLSAVPTDVAAARHKLCAPIMTTQFEGIYHGLGTDVGG
jgi:hypothetical protein